MLLNVIALVMALLTLLVMGIAPIYAGYLSRQDD